MNYLISNSSPKNIKGCCDGESGYLPLIQFCALNFVSRRQVYRLSRLGYLSIITYKGKFFVKGEVPDDDCR